MWLHDACLSAGAAGGGRGGGARGHVANGGRVGERGSQCHPAAMPQQLGPERNLCHLMPRYFPLRWVEFCKPEH